MDPICDITVTADDADWLTGLVRRLVEDRLVACGNITLTPVRSIYRWEGAVEEADEVTVVLHTRASLAHEVIARVVAEHPYDNPQVLALPVVVASPAYQQWVLDETSDLA